MAQKNNVSSETYHAGGGLWRPLLEKGLEEDGWRFDWTTLSALDADAQSRTVTARIVVKAQGVWAAEGLVGEVARTSAEWGMPLDVKILRRDGDLVRPGDEACVWSGPARAVLALERPFLNLASFVCGIATRTRRLTEVVAAAAGGGPSPRVTATRKTLPAYRDLSLHGVICGGGSVHRVNLFSGILIKENHIAAAGGVAEAVKSARARAPHGLRVEVEVRNERELDQAIDAGAEIVMLDNFTPEQARKAAAHAKSRRPGIVVEISGGLDAGNIGQYVLPGVDILSSGSITHSAGSLDLSLLVEERT